MKKPTEIQVNITLTVIVLIVSLLILFPVKAEAGGYVGASYNQIDFDGLTDHTGMTIHGGYAFNEVIAIEGRMLASSSEENYDGANIDIDHLYGIYLIGTLPVTDSLGVYAMFGHSSGEITASYMGYSESVDDGSSSIGVGLKYDIVEAWTVTAEYTELFDDVDQFSVGIKLNF